MFSEGSFMIRLRLKLFLVLRLLLSTRSIFCHLSTVSEWPNYKKRQVCDLSTDNFHFTSKILLSNSFPSLYLKDLVLIRSISLSCVRPSPGTTRMKYVSALIHFPLFLRVRVVSLQLLCDFSILNSSIFFAITWTQLLKSSSRDGAIKTCRRSNEDHEDHIEDRKD